MNFVCPVYIFSVLVPAIPMTILFLFPIFFIYFFRSNPLLSFPASGSLSTFLLIDLTTIAYEMNMQPMLDENYLILRVVLSKGNSTDSNFLTIKNIRKHEPSA
ncbi:hypothetical protein SAMN04488084_11114 [Pedobacter antarcticus]|nr:hypothetical protein SAMN04488084_11114 [Pedobacter antarcticus]